MECLCCFDEINNPVKYQSEKDGPWKDCHYCKNCIDYMLETQFTSYIDNIKKETCKVALEKLIKLKPPLKFRDPTINEGKEIYTFDGFSAELKNVYSEEELEKYREFINNLL